MKNDIFAQFSFIKSLLWRICILNSIEWKSRKKLKKQSIEAHLANNLATRNLQTSLRNRKIESDSEKERQKDRDRVTLYFAVSNSLRVIAIKRHWHSPCCRPKKNAERTLIPDIDIRWIYLSFINIVRQLKYFKFVHGDCFPNIEFNPNYL